MALTSSKEVQEYLDRTHNSNLNRYTASDTMHEIVSSILGMKVWQVTLESRTDERGEFSTVDGSNYYITEDSVLFSVPVAKASEEEFSMAVNQAYQDLK